MDIFTYAVAKKAGGGGGSITVDRFFSTISSNPVRNSTITDAINKILGKTICFNLDLTEGTISGDKNPAQVIEYLYNDEQIIGIGAENSDAEGVTFVLDYSNGDNIDPDVRMHGILNDGERVIFIVGTTGGWSYTIRQMLPDASYLPDESTLTVIDNAWVDADPANPLIITASASGMMPNVTVSIDEELEDLYAVAQNGRQIYLDVMYAGFMPLRFPLVQYHYDEEDGYALAFEAVRNISNVPTLMTIVFEESKTTAIIITNLATAT